jgi:hypothetical protein
VLIEETNGGVADLLQHRLQIAHRLQQIGSDAHDSASLLNRFTQLSTSVNDEDDENYKKFKK